MNDQPQLQAFQTVNRQPSACLLCYENSSILRGNLRRSQRVRPSQCAQHIASHRTTRSPLGGLTQAIVLFAIIAASCCLSADAQSPASAASTAKGLPDIVFILSDDQAYNDYSFMGHAHIRTPNLDQLARESRLFTRGYVPNSLCRPSLATIISGLYPHQHGIVGNDPPPPGTANNVRAGRYADPDYQLQIEKYLETHIDRLTTLPERLDELGYVSYQCGKWWEGNAKRGGFTDGMTHGDHKRGGRHGDVGLEIGRKGMSQIETYIQQARQANKPYFLWYAPMLPHTPHDPPERLLAKYRALAPTEPIAKYWAMCELFDETIGQLRTVIKQRGRPDNTLIVYVTDNGWINLPNKSAYAPRSKRSPNEGGIRTPIMFSWPGHIQPGRDEEQLVSSIDLVPTTLALLEQPAVPELPGINVLDASALRSRDTLYGEIFEHDIVDMHDAAASLQYRWIISGHDKLIVPAKRMQEASIQWYDLAKDPNEEHDLMASDTTRPQENPKVAELLFKLSQWWNVQ